MTIEDHGLHGGADLLSNNSLKVFHVGNASAPQAGSAATWTAHAKNVRFRSAALPSSAVTVIASGSETRNDAVRN